MAGLNLGQVNFSKGVLGPDLQSRIDISAYNAGLRRGVNVVVLKYGGIQNRPGTRFVRELPGDGLLLPFEYSTDFTYALAMTQGAMRPISNGGSVLEQEALVAGITNANPAVVTVAFHGLSTGDEVYFQNIEGMEEINYRMLPATVIDDNTFSVPVDSRAWGVFTGSGGGTENTAPPPPPPPPPPVPPPAPTPTPPPTGGGGGINCVTDDSLFLLADGSEVAGSDLRAGMEVWARHERTWRHGAFKVMAVEFSDDLAMAYGDYPDATPNHRFARDDWWVRFVPQRFRWWHMRNRGVTMGIRRVAKVTVEHAHTYYSRRPIPGSPWRLCHNLKNRDTP